LQGSQQASSDRRRRLNTGKNLKARESRPSGVYNDVQYYDELANCSAAFDMFACTIDKYNSYENQSRILGKENEYSKE